jgi:hydroxymethyl cephem carbamoyltransferase
MLVVAVNPGHDGAIAAVRDRELLFSIEGEKDSYRRHGLLHPDAMLSLAAKIDEPPDVIAVGGWGKPGALGSPRTGGGYEGVSETLLSETQLFGRHTKLFSSSHERSHIAMAVGMAPRNDAGRHAVLVWEGTLGHLYELDEKWAVTQRIPVMWSPGTRFAFLYALADPTFPDIDVVRAEDAGKLMALAAYGDPGEADAAISKAIERILTSPSITGGLSNKGDFADTPLYNAGLESAETKVAAALLSKRLFDTFAQAARTHLPEGIPLYISGGCGLNCDWNVAWRDLGHFSSVFVPPCANDSGSALGTAIDAVSTLTGDPHIDWNVYRGLEFEWDQDPDPASWQRRDLDLKALADTITSGSIVAWVQGRWEIGPRALGARSLLAEPFDPRTRDRLNEVKLREGFRPIAPCCRLEDAGELFDDASEDPYMLYFRRAKSGLLGAVTHVDGTARAQTVTKDTNRLLHDLLSEFAKQRGVGVLCNTSLNFKGLGFINRMSDLVAYCEARGVPEMVVGNAWFRFRGQGSSGADPGTDRVAVTVA